MYNFAFNYVLEGHPQLSKFFRTYTFSDSTSPQCLFFLAFLLLKCMLSLLHSQPQE